MTGLDRCNCGMKSRSSAGTINVVDFQFHGKICPLTDDRNREVLSAGSKSVGRKCPTEYVLDKAR